MSKVTIRPATAHDLPAINEIYNHYVQHSTATFDEAPTTDGQRRDWWESHADRLPVLVAEQGSRVIGWAALSPYHGRCAYRFTVETSIYLRPEVQGRGLGRRLLGELLEAGRDGGWHSAVAVIEASAGASLRVHAAVGFREVGRLREVGYKFGRWLDVVFMQRMF
jgi:L-amino acid N-acyltransferase YncA